jgi:3-oxoacyl-[acyl-carrier-protein] synthase II
MMRKELTNPFVITGWDVVSSISLGKQSFSEGLAKKKSGLKKISGDNTLFPCDVGHYVDNFNIADHIGNKGTRHYDRTTELSVVTSGMILKETLTSDRSNFGVVLGTSMGSIKSISDFGCESLLNERPYLVNPMDFPNTVMNCAASQVAIRYGCKGLNATVSGGQLASLNALHYALTVLEMGYASTLLVGAVEEFCDKSAWGFYHAGLLSDNQFPGIGEGCAMFLLENFETSKESGRVPLLEILGCALDFCPYENNKNDFDTLTHTLVNCIEKVISSHRLFDLNNCLVLPSQYGNGFLNQAERAAINKVFDGRKFNNFSVKELVGECYSASGALQIASFIALNQSLDFHFNYALITSVSRSGSVGCTLVSRWAP